MKKILLFAMALLALASCKKGFIKPEMGTDIDTISYQVGVVNSYDAQMAMQQSGVDSAYVSEFIKGVEEAVENGDDKKKMARYVGIMFGMQSNSQLEQIQQYLFDNDSTQTLSRKNYLAGLESGFKKGSKMSQDGAPVEQQQAFEEVNKRIQIIRAKKYEGNKKEGAEFLKKNEKKPGVKKLANGVQYKVLKEGQGEKPEASSQVKMFYEGRLIDGTVFESNYDQSEPVACVPAQMIPGFSAALQQMTEGSEWEIYIPTEQGYGERESGPIPPYSTLIFKVKLVSVEKAAQPQMMGMPQIVEMPN